MTRRRLTERQVLTVMLSQGAILPCYRCRIALTPEDALQAEREHLTPLALGGEDTPDNCRYSHRGCHKKQTNGTAATSYGSDKHAIAKVRRLTGANKPKVKRAWPKRKIQSRSWK